MKHYNIRVTGKVQGVFFRDSTRNKANDLGVKGFVRNEPDGSVYIEAEAGEETLKEFTEWCKQGPSSAVVDDIEIKEAEPAGFTSFEIRF